MEDNGTDTKLIYKVVQIWPGLIFFFVTIIDKHLLAHAILQRTPLTRAGGRVEVVASLSQGRTAAAQCGLFTHKSVPVIFEPPCRITGVILYRITRVILSDFFRYEYIPVWFRQDTTAVKIRAESTGIHVFQQTHYVKFVSRSSFSWTTNIQLIRNLLNLFSKFNYFDLVVIKGISELETRENFITHAHKDLSESRLKHFILKKSVT